MGMSISEIDGLTFWQYTAMLHEFNRRQQNPTNAEPMTDAEYDEFIEELKAWNLPDMQF